MRRAFPIAAVAVVTAVCASAASATIVPQQGIAGVKIGMTKAKVRSVLGVPSSVKTGTNDFGTYTIFKYGGLQASFQGNATLTSVSTTRRSERTARGIGVGSSEGQVKAKVKGVTCKTDSGFRHCYLGTFTAGHRVTDFAIRRGEVYRVDVGAVID